MQWFILINVLCFTFCLFFSQEAKEYEDIIKDLRLEIACKNQEITRLNLSQDDVANTSNFYHLQAKVNIVITDENAL